MGVYRRSLPAPPFPGHHPLGSKAGVHSGRGSTAHAAVLPRGGRSMTTSVGVGRLEPLQVEIRRVRAAQAFEWLSRGWEDLKRIGKPGLAHGALIAILGAVLLTLGSTH